MWPFLAVWGLSDVEWLRIWVWWETVVLIGVSSLLTSDGVSSDLFSHIPLTVGNGVLFNSFGDTVVSGISSWLSEVADLKGGSSSDDECELEHFV